MCWLVSNFKNFDNKVAIVDDTKSYTYKELFLKVKEIEGSLSSQIEDGEVVAVVDDYSFYSISWLLALHKHKNIIVPIASKIQSEIQDRVKESFSTKIVTIKDGKYIVTPHKQSTTHKMISTLQKNSSSGLILFSSGSTGKPKAMIHNFDNLVNHYKDKKEKSMNMLVFLMFDHIGGLNTLLNILSMGATMIIPKNRNADDICKLVQEYKIRVLPSSPTFLNLILMSKADEKYDLKSLRMITYGTETMPESLLFRLKEKFPKTKFLQTFGTSETGIANASSKSSNSTFMKINDPNLEYKIVKNELWLKSDTQVMGYLNASMDSFEDGWFKTGDLVESTADGYLKIIGRSKEIINVGGEKVLPNEIESILLGMDEVDDAIVYGEKNTITGQSVVCDVVTDTDAKEIKKLVRKYCKNKIPRYKIPTKVNVVEKTNFSDRFKKIRIKNYRTNMLNKINIKDIENIALKASQEVLMIYNQDFDVEYKSDNSPLTKADLKANDIICSSLKKLYPNIPIMSEENKQIEYNIRTNWQYYWCIDPIDGTKEFIKKNGEFTINIALVYKNIPILGVVYAPVLEDMYSAKEGFGAYKNGIKLPIKREHDKLVIVASKSHLSDETKKFIQDIQTSQKKLLISKGSSLKLCMVAEGIADIYPRLAPTMEWDTAAADAIVRESGKISYQYGTNKPLVYNKKELLNPWFIVK